MRKSGKWSVGFVSACSVQCAVTPSHRVVCRDRPTPNTRRETRCGGSRCSALNDPLSGGGSNDRPPPSTPRRGRRRWWPFDGDDGDNRLPSPHLLLLIASSRRAPSLRKWRPRRRGRGDARAVRCPGRDYCVTRDASVTDALTVITIASFVLQMLAGSSWVMAGAKVNDAIRAGEYHRLITPLFLHGNALHLLVNVSSLRSLGPQVEATHGHWRYALLYLCSGLAGNALSYRASPAASVGASSAIFGLVGALGTFYAQNGDFYGRPYSQMVLRNVAWVTVLNFAQGVAPGSRIDNYGHLGGLLGGALFGALFGPRLFLAPGGRIVDIPVVRGVTHAMWSGEWRWPLLLPPRS
ncbi:hypothetical protein CDCA_CDCA18G4482 [Cyanidium caldarium]|uniref:Peptidase S54 rhomboid domain-containing protein n=1 Tax=Cyanidium caldarium TaxID=2771 RepID=A0AAV9J1G5_CYACA|nr:hypothetical protein CDCA_CDCA18G4482 [Cyanidium caldarium]